jgi:hypothetical protein
MSNERIYHHDEVKKMFVANGAIYTNVDLDELAPYCNS